MNLLDVINSPWAIQEEKLIEIRDVYITHLRGEKIDVKALEAAAGRPFANKHEGYINVDGVAVIPVQGVIAKRANLFTQICGGVSTQQLQADIAQAVNDPSVHSIILDVDSPGGTVDGTQAAADAVRAVRGVKPIYALIDGVGASAAYWIGSAADKVFISSDTSIVGSIGVVYTHVDYSKQDEQRGIKVTEITAGKYKRIASEHAPLNAEGRADFQGRADHVYSVFVDAVAANRGTDVDTVLNKMADGRVFLGKNAIEAGLADGISSLPALVKQLNEKRAASAYSGASASRNEGETMELVIGGKKVTTQAEADAAIAEIEAAAKTNGATAERERIQGVEAQLIPGHETLIGTLKFDGKTSGPEAAAQVVAAEKKLRTDAAANIAKEAPKTVPTSVPDPKTEAAASGVDDKAKGKGTDEGTAVKQAQVLAKKAQAYQAEQAKLGITVSLAEAVMHVSDEK